MTNSFTGADELERYKNIAAATVEMLETMDAGLNRIANCQLSDDAEIVMKRIAKQTLSEVKKIAARIEPKGEKVNA